MINYPLMNKTVDLHIHTLVSDGNATPLRMLEAAKEAGLQRVSFTDHDALGAYRRFGDVFALARGHGIDLLPGIELDTDHLGREVHLLGYGFDLDDKPLNAHLAKTQGLRRERVKLQLAMINRFFGRQVVELDKVLLEARETLMKPHLVHAMLAQGLFADYRAAAYWISQNARVAVEVPKLPLAAAIAMVRHANGEAVLAHPGYMARETNISLAALLEEFVPLGLAGLEVDYPYFQENQPGSVFPDRGSETKMIGELRALARRFKLKTTRGSDAHDPEGLMKFAQTGPVEGLKS
jgi:3',5'-nucleoside bisphosphate phosphatase